MHLMQSSSSGNVRFDLKLFNSFDDMIRKTVCTILNSFRHRPTKIQ